MAVQSPPPITPAPSPAPQRGDRTTFSARVDAFVTWLTAAVAQFSAVATNVFNNATDAFNNAFAADASADAAAASATSANSSQSNAGSYANAAQQWSMYLGGPVSGTDYSSKHYMQVAQAAATMAGNTVAFSDNLPVIKNFTDVTKRAFWNAAGITTGTDRTYTLPNKNGTMALLDDILPSTLVRYPLASATTLVAADARKIIECSATFILTLLAAATAGNGWYTYVRNTGASGLVTIAASGGQVINGVTGGAQYVYPGEGYLLYTNGTAWFTVLVESSSSAGFGRPFLHLIYGNGVGSTNVGVLRFQAATVNNNLGHFTYTDSAAGGMSVTVNYPGLYFFEMTAQVPISTDIGISANSSNPASGDVGVLSPVQIVGLSMKVSSSNPGVATCFGWRQCVSGDIIRAHASGNTQTDSLNLTHFRMVRIGN